MANIIRGLLPLFAAGSAAVALSPDEAEAAPRPKYMEELVEKLKSDIELMKEKIKVIDENLKGNE